MPDISYWSRKFYRIRPEVPTSEFLHRGAIYSTEKTSRLASLLFTVHVHEQVYTTKHTYTNKFSTLQVWVTRQF